MMVCPRPKSETKEKKMLNEMLLTTTLCVAIVGVMALFYGELELLQNNH